MGAGVPVIAVEWNAQRKFLLRNDFECVIEVVDRPLPAGDGTRHRPARVLVVGHQAEQVDGFGQLGDVVSTAPVGVDPLGEAALTRRVAGRVGNGGDAELQAGLVQRVG